MGDDKLHCGGLVDGMECKATQLVEVPHKQHGIGIVRVQWECYGAPIAAAYHDPIRRKAEWRTGGARQFGHCMVCGARVGFTDKGEPTREAMVPEEELHEAEAQRLSRAFRGLIEDIHCNCTEKYGEDCPIGRNILAGSVLSGEGTIEELYEELRGNA